MRALNQTLTVFFLLAGIKAGGQTPMPGNASMVLIPGGEFMMGKDSQAGADFSPAHRERTDSFYMDPYEVTNAEYLQFCKATGYKLPEFWNSTMFRSGEKYPDYPVIGVNWYDAKKYAEWAGKRLPTEIEWEYAARGGLTGMEYPNGNTWNLEKASQSQGEWENLIEPAGKYEPNGYGLYDMGGNVWEWVNDRYYADNYQVIRGGSWHSGAMCKKVYYRKGLPGNWCDFAVGFRCVKDIR